jgi:glycosyltransferase involved in cell wall biosynthesis
VASNKPLTLSIIIPAYNEELYIRTCLEAIAAQTVMPEEVIVVDNNCTDKTLEVARSFDFVRIVKEPRQGRAYARNAGFDAAATDIIGRIDADSRLAPDWAERVLKDFEDPEVVGVTGLGNTNLLPWMKYLYLVFWSRVYFWVVHLLFGTITGWGANMAVRNSEWKKVRDKVFLDDTYIHEDQDVSVWVQQDGGVFIHDHGLLVKTEGQVYFYWPRLWNYITRSIHTSVYHKKHLTLKNNPKARISIWRLLPGGIAGWFFASIFILVSFICWPFTEIIHRRGERRH